MITNRVGTDDSPVSREYMHLRVLPSSVQKLLTEEINRLKEEIQNSLDKNEPLEIYLIDSIRSHQTCLQELKNGNRAGYMDISIRIQYPKGINTKEALIFMEPERPPPTGFVGIPGVGYFPDRGIFKGKP